MSAISPISIRECLLPTHLQTLACDEHLRPDHDLNAIRGNVEQNSNLAPKLIQTLTSAYFRLMRGRRPLVCKVPLTLGRGWR